MTTIEIRYTRTEVTPGTTTPTGRTLTFTGTYTADTERDALAEFHNDYQGIDDVRLVGITRRPVHHTDGLTPTQRTRETFTATGRPATGRAA